MVRPKILTLGALALALALVLSSGHAATKPQIVDVKGDANGINDQGPGVTLPPKGPVTPTQYDALDILTVLANTEYTGKGRLRRPAYVTYTMTLAGSPTADNIPRRYRVMFTSPRCPSAMVEFDYTPVSPGGLPNELDLGVTTVFIWTPGFRLLGCGSNPEVSLPLSKIVGRSIVWRIPVSIVGKAGLLVGDLRAETRLRPRGAYPYPVMDIARGPIATYKIGT